jgi:alpha,alpha-trehalose phosphorylase
VRFAPELLAQAESLFALSNGHLGLRGNLDEGGPAFVHGTYLNGFYERRPIPYAERGPGDPKTTEVVVNVTDGKRLHLLVDGEAVDVRDGGVLFHERCLPSSAVVGHSRLISRADLAW